MAEQPRLSFNDYQRLAHDTAIYPAERAVEYVALGLASEAGEVAGKIKKQIRDGREWNGAQRADHRYAIVSELGDILWYIAELCSIYNIPLEDVAQHNVDKLQSRAQRGALRGSGDTR